MGKFQDITKYIALIKDDKYGDWLIDQENDGSTEHPIQMPFVGYSEMVDHFINDVYTFEENNKDMALNEYGKILNRNGLEWSAESMAGANVSFSNAECIMALLMGAIRAERFCDGALLSFFENGSILKWLKRLKELDES